MMFAACIRLSFYHEKDWQDLHARLLPLLLFSLKHMACVICWHTKFQIAITISHVTFSSVFELSHKCMQRARKEVFARPKIRARKSVKTLFNSTQMLFKVASCFCVWIQTTFGTARSDIDNLFQLRSCC